MKVFLSWSGARSYQLAEALNLWLPQVLHRVDPWLSSEGIAKGARWGAELARQLESTNAGILCVTPENRDAPWLLYEAGSLAKTVDRSLVIPLLFGMAPSDLEGPLAQLNAAIYDEADMRRVIRDLNAACEPEGMLTEFLVESSFNKWWPDLAGALARVPLEPPDSYVPPQRTSEDMLAEILALVRQSDRPVARPVRREAVSSVEDDLVPPTEYDESVLSPGEAREVVRDRLAAGVASDEIVRELTQRGAPPKVADDLVRAVADGRKNRT